MQEWERNVKQGFKPWESLAENGEMLLTKCSEHELAITNKLFNYSEKWYQSWKHPRSKHPTLLD